MAVDARRHSQDNLAVVQTEDQNEKERQFNSL